jgi:hypothetical protein
LSRLNTWFLTLPIGRIKSQPSNLNELSLLDAHEKTGPVDQAG